LVARGIADGDRLAIGGWSYGGILTDYSIATDRRFKAAHQGRQRQSAHDLRHGSIHLQYNNELGPPWRDTALWLKLSYPFFHADRIHTPTLFLGATRTSTFHQRWRADVPGAADLGSAARLVVYPDQHHIFTRPSFVKDLAERMSAWLDRYVPAHQ